MVKGVFYDKRTKIKPFKINLAIVNGIQKTRYFATGGEAVVALAVSKMLKNVTLKARKEYQRQHVSLVEKREKDVAIYGNCCNMEREFAILLVNEWERCTGKRGIILNDGTRADILLEMDDMLFLRVQLKTTGGAMKYKKNSWEFSQVSGYTGMPVVCWRCDKEDAWVYDGKTLEGRTHLYITPNGVNCALSMGKHLDLESLVSFFKENGSLWEHVSEDDARHEFQSQNHAKEMRGIDAYKSRFSNSKFCWPSGQNTHVDLLENDQTLQFKNLCEQEGQAGFLCNFTTSNGKDHDGKTLKTPYSHGSFDVLVAVWFDAHNTPHFWKIPADVLVERGVFATETQPGKTGFYFYGPEGVGKPPNPNVGRKSDTWTRDFFLE